MKPFHTLTLWACLCSSLCMQAQPVSRTATSVRVNPTDGGLATELLVYSPSAVRVVKYPQELTAMPERSSYSIIASPARLNDFATIRETDDDLLFTTDLLIVRVDLTSGNVRFATPDGTRLLSESAASMTCIEEGVDAGQYQISQTWQLDPDEVILGLGQRNVAELNQRGLDVEIWSTNTNITIPYFCSQKGYGLYWDNAGESRFTDNAGGTTFSSSVARFEDYYFLYGGGSLDSVVAAIRQLTGPATLFPLWAMGHWQCRERYGSGDEVCEVLDRYRELEIPVDVIVQDWQYWGCDSNWNAMAFQNPRYINKLDDPDALRFLPKGETVSPEDIQKEPRIKSPQEMLDYVHSHGARMMISIWPDFGPWTPQYAELDAIGALFPFETWPKQTGVKVYDPWNPAARDIYWKHLLTLYNMGFDAWWTDSTEPDHFEEPGDRDILTHDGSLRSVKNAFALMTNRGIYEHQRATKGNRQRSLQMTRCGTFGMQRYATFSWSGDINCDWQTFKRQIPSGLNYSVCGIPFWNTDIAGFFTWDFANDPTSPALQELQVRWMQWAAFLPLMRNHCSGPMINELYRFGSPGDWAFDVQKQYIQLRYRLLPYIYSAAADCHYAAGTMMRPLVFDFPSDAKAVQCADEYLFGKSFLVRPVTDPLYTYRDEQNHGHTIYPDVRQAAAPVSVYLPEGTAWYDFWTNECLDGGHTLQRLAPIDVMPVYVRAGTILPWGPDVQWSTEKAWDDLEIRVYPGADASFTLYEDDGLTYDYERGKFTRIRMDWDDTARKLVIREREGKYDGMLRQRQFRVTLIGSSETLTLAYDGSEATAQF